ncbi:MAG: hypothetical protein QM571_05670 [Micrococcaceae bacterium]
MLRNTEIVAESYRRNVVEKTLPSGGVFRSTRGFHSATSLVASVFAGDMVNNNGGFMAFLSSHFDSGCHHLRKVVRNDGCTVWVNCGSRIASFCPYRSRLYQRDWQMIAFDGYVDVDVVDYKWFWVTLTQPSFGVTHFNQNGGKCKCGRIHSENDPYLNLPINPARYDYDAQVFNNYYAGELWKRYTGED